MTAMAAAVINVIIVKGTPPVLEHTRTTFQVLGKYLDATNDQKRDQELRGNGVSRRSFFQYSTDTGGPPLFEALFWNGWGSNVPTVESAPQRRIILSFLL